MTTISSRKKTPEDYVVPITGKKGPQQLDFDLLDARTVDDVGQGAAELAAPDCSSPVKGMDTDCIRAGSVRPIRRELSGPGYNKIC